MSVLRRGCRTPAAVAGFTGVLLGALGNAGAETLPDEFLGVWSGSFTTQDHEFWMVEDFTACFAGCSVAARAYFASLLDDPANDERPVQALWDETTGFARRELSEKSTEAGRELQNAPPPEADLAGMCEPYGLVREATNPLPLALRRDDGQLLIQYEEWNLSRKVYMDGRELPTDIEPSLLGYSVGRVDGGTLVIESTGVAAGPYFAFQSGGGHSDDVRIVERYTVEEKPRRLVLEMTVTDPVTLTEPHVLEKIWLATPELELVRDSCSDVPGEF